MKRKVLKSLVSIGMASALLLTACGGSTASSDSSTVASKEEAVADTAAEETNAASKETAQSGSTEIVKLRFSMMKPGGLIPYGKAEFLRKSAKKLVLPLK